MVTITPTEGGRGQLAINVGPGKVKLDCSSPDNAIEMSDEDYVLCKVQLSDWVAKGKITVSEDVDTDVLAEVDAGATTPKKTTTKKKPAKKKGFLKSVLGGKPDPDPDDGAEDLAVGAAVVVSLSGDSGGDDSGGSDGSDGGGSDGDDSGE